MKLREAGALVERSHEEAERIRGLRQAEKEKADQRLKEKMQKKKVKRIICGERNSSITVGEMI